jgi:hypothetical protein
MKPVAPQLSDFTVFGSVFWAMKQKNPDSHADMENGNKNGVLPQGRTPLIFTVQGRR